MYISQLLLAPKKNKLTKNGQNVQVECNDNEDDEKQHQNDSSDVETWKLWLIKVC